MRTKLRMYAVVISVLWLAGCTAALAQCSDSLDRFLPGAQSDRLKSISQLHARGLAAIPALLLEIGNDRKAEWLTLTSPISSTLPHDLTFTYCGLVSAYLIEVILSQDRLELDTKSRPKEAADYHILGWKYGCYPYLVGAIFVSRGTKSERQIGQADLAAVAAKYSAWWDANKFRSLEQLRAAWAKGERPLSGSIFEWH
jgi:hypothetical protein